MRTVTAMAALILAVAGLCAWQQNVPPPPHPSEGGPSLEETMKFIQQKLSARGTINYVQVTLIEGDGDTRTRWSMMHSKVIADAPACRLSYSILATRNGVTSKPSERELSFKDVERLQVATYQDAFNTAFSRSAALGDPRVSITPVVHELEVRLTDGKRYGFLFYEEEMAHRVAKAMLHAVGLCGGGKEPF